MHNSLSIVIHGDAGVGKSRLGDTSPSPRLFLDAEGGTRFNPSLRKGRGIIWDPNREEIPHPSGDWETAVVTAREFSAVEQVTRILESGKHPFRSIVVDTLTEVQQRCKLKIAGLSQPEFTEWGEILRQMEDQVRRWRDLVWVPDNPLEVLVIICQSDERGKTQTKIGPVVQGQLRSTLSTFVDIVGYLYTTVDDSGSIRRGLQVQPARNVIAKDRTDALGDVVWDPSIPNILERIYGATAVPLKGAEAVVAPVEPSEAAQGV